VVPVHYNTRQTTFAQGATTQPNSPPAIVNNIGQTKPNQEHLPTYQPQLRMGYAGDKADANSLPPGDRRSKRTSQTHIVKVLKAAATPGVNERRPGEVAASANADRGKTRRERGRINKERKRDGRFQRVPASAVLAHTTTSRVFCVRIQRVLSTKNNPQNHQCTERVC
jgi:hypothetical protein